MSKQCQEWTDAGFTHYQSTVRRILPEQVARVSKACSVQLLECELLGAFFTRRTTFHVKGPARQVGLFRQELGKLIK